MWEPLATSEESSPLAGAAAQASSCPVAPQLQELLAPFPAERRGVRVSFSSDGRTFEARVFLALPTGNLVGCSPIPRDHSAAAVDDAVRALAEQLSRHARQLRREKVEDRDRRRARDFAAAEPCLTLMHQRGDEEGFHDVLRPLLRSFRGHAARELILSQLSAEVAAGTMSIGTLLDETAARAWTRWKVRLRTPLDRWLVGLLHAVLDVLARPSERCLPRTVASAEGFDVADGRAVAGTPLRTHDDSFAADAIIGTDDDSQNLPASRPVVYSSRAVLLELSRFPKDRRRAFTLYVFEGWPLSDVAALQHRREPDVRRLIRMTRVTILERLGVPSA